MGVCSLNICKLIVPLGINRKTWFVRTKNIPFRSFCTDIPPCKGCITSPLNPPVLSDHYMARPTKNKEQQLLSRLEIRLHASEKIQLEEAAQVAGLTISDFIRREILKRKPKRKPLTPERAALLRGLSELGKIGSNVNQVARALHRRAETEGYDLANYPPELIGEALQGVATLTRHLIIYIENGH